MQFIVNDGGRAAAGYKGKTGDCVCRAIAIATGRPYQEVYDRLAIGNKTQRITKHSSKGTAGKLTARNGIYTSRKWFKDYMAELGFEYITLVPVFGQRPPTVNEFLRIRSMGRVVLSLRRHSAAMINGVIHDTWDSSKNGTAPVFGYWLLLA